MTASFNQVFASLAAVLLFGMFSAASVAAQPPQTPPPASPPEAAQPLFDSDDMFVRTG